MVTINSLITRHSYLLIALPGVLVLSIAMVVSESSRTMTGGNFTNLIRSLVDSTQHIGAAQVLSEIRSRYIWLAIVTLNIVVSVYVTVLCAFIMYRTLSRRRLLVVMTVGVILCAIGLISGSKTMACMSRLATSCRRSALCWPPAARRTAGFASHVADQVQASNRASVGRPDVLSLLKEACNG
ncbi:MAG TPA: hypothetical protein VJ692_08550 [Nitrospiraceae bacterium]|nr:hypothetical protein [Nitrospiraceae bacterium]